MPDSLVPSEVIESRIYLIRGRKVMIDRDLAALYGVLTKALNQAVRRNLSRFPEDFMFQLSTDETKNWKSQFVTSNSDRMGWRKRPLAFTEQGVAMLSSVLKSERAVMVNIQIIRTFTRLRELLAGHAGLRRKVEALESKYDERFRVVFDALRRLLDDGASDHEREIGFRT
ncbi:MAG: ORF6N domain-containing protein [Patescibacteria group bacterium]|nr:ORF6N domain-containing protein [Patescibacteria group bacterium]